MVQTQQRTERWHRYWDKKSRSYDREMRFMERMLFGDSRAWACAQASGCLLYTSPSPRDGLLSRMPSSA